MKLFKLILVIAMCLFLSNVHATETLPEKNESFKNEIKRDANKELNRVDEATCTGTDTECMKNKIGNRTEEGKELIQDKSNEIKNKVD
ncbi:hypothetical protein [Nitrosomonas supralitoralis]|uniref:Uncharacterized protein n=1 Tax=Nitrosomonas supralitoralis TaxID=2116706 RepID=A0A2P7NSC3_9PROT|nr:hypothetical protein [Nitrosomonas supralitoralis]PSJ16366.1 hypothetical protein C7H79_13760 [Nitrosomonas supralitoralis]